MSPPCITPGFRGDLSRTSSVISSDAPSTPQPSTSLPHPMSSSSAGMLLSSYYANSSSGRGSFVSSGADGGRRKHSDTADSVETASR